MAVFWTLVAVFLYRAIASPARPSRRGDEPRASATEVLEQRLACGEITADEYRERRDLLTTHPTTTPPSATPGG